MIDRQRPFESLSIDFAQLERRKANEYEKLDRMVAREVMAPAFLGCVTYTFLLMMRGLFGLIEQIFVRGLPLRADGWFGLALFTDFSARAPVGILDWYTVLVGAFAVLALALHGALYLAWRTDGAVRERSLAIARPAAIATVLAWPLVTWATVAVHPTMFDGFAHRPLAWVSDGSCPALRMT